MKTKQRTFTVTFRDRDLPGVLDMLRYDAAIVLDWAREAKSWRDGEERWTLTLRSDRFTPDRWQSFGLRPVETL